MVLFNRYEYSPQTDLLGKGGFSRVYKALDKKLNRPVALKIYKTAEISERYSLGSEIQRVINLDHPNVSRYLDIDDFENKNAFGEVEKIQVCVMELLDGGNILSYYRAHKESAVLIKLLVDVLKGLSYLHENDIIHRDIKPGNILIKNTKSGPVAKITDFGISKISGAASNPDSSSALIVSIPYMAPEQLNVKKFGIDGRVSFNIDLWSFGVAVYEIVSGDILFRNNPEDSPEQIMLNIMALGIPDKIFQLPEPFRSFVSKCVIKDARERTDDIDSLIELLTNKSVQPAGQTQVPEKPAVGVIEISGNLPVVSGGVIDIAASNIGIETQFNAELVNQAVFSTPGNDLQNLPEGLTDSATPPEAVKTDVFSASANVHKFIRELPVIDRAAADNQGLDDIFNDIRPSSVESDGDDTQVLGLKATEEKVSEELTFPEGAAASLTVMDDSDDTRILQLPPLAVETNTDDTALLVPGLLAAAVDQDDTQVLKHSGILKANAADLQQAGRENSNENADADTLTAGVELENKILLFKRYEYYPNRNLIGKGGFSRVYKAFDKKLQRWVALKIYKTGNFSDRYSPIAEIQRVVNLDHSNICRYLDIEEIEKINPFGEKETIQVCVMELLDSGNLLQYFQGNPDPKIFKKLLQDVFMGLSYLHKNGIIHRDIKPANILIKETIDGPIAKITDFGISKKSDAVNNNSSSALVVSIPYMAPEQLNVKKYGIDSKISYNLDLWSLGVTIYEVLSGKVLFKNSDADNSEQIMTNIMAAELPDKIQELVAPFAEIVARCIVKKAPDRAQRVEELMAILSRDTGLLPPRVPVDDNLSAAARQANDRIVLPAERPDGALISTEKTASHIKNSFYVLEDDVQKNNAKKSSRKKYLLFALFSAVLIITIIAAVFVTKRNIDSLSNMPAAKDSNGMADTVTIAQPAVVTDSVKAVVVDSLDYQTKNEKPNAEPPNNKSSKNNIDPAEKLRNRDQSGSAKNSPKRGKISGDTYLLELNAAVTCIVKINSFNYGEIKAGGKMKVWLSAGNYQIKVTDLVSNTEIYTKTIEVGADQLGSVGHLQIR